MLCTGGVHALQFAAWLLTGALGGASVISPELEAHWVVLSPVPAAALPAGNTGAVVEQEATVTGTGLHAGQAAGGGSARIHARGRAGGCTSLVVAVGWAGNGCRKANTFQEMVVGRLIPKDLVHLEG